MPSVTLYRPSSVCRTEYYRVAASTALTIDTIVTADEDATTQTIAAPSATFARVLGIVQKAVASTDSDYASAKRLPVLVDENGIWEFSVGTGTADANDEQGYIDLTDNDQVDVTISARDNVFVTNFVSGTVVRGYIVRWAQHEAPALI